MKYQLTGLKVSLVIHAAVFTLVFGISRLYVTPSTSVAIEIGILTDAADATNNDVHQKFVHQVKRPARSREVAKPVVQQQEAPSKTATSEKPVLKQEEVSTQTTANETLTASAVGSNNNASAVVGPVFDADYLKNPKPLYPPIARRMKLEGTVVVQVLISTEGKPENVRIRKSSGTSLLDEAALTAVQNWSFVPARQGNNPISAWVDVPLRFR